MDVGTGVGVLVIVGIATDVGVGVKVQVPVGIGVTVGVGVSVLLGARAAACVGLMMSVGVRREAEEPSACMWGANTPLAPHIAPRQARTRRNHLAIIGSLLIPGIQRPRSGFRH